MKRKSIALLLSLLLLLALCVPALAAIEYGVFYDETEQLVSVELSYAAEQTLPRLTQELGVDLRVDAFTDEDVDARKSASTAALRTPRISWRRTSSAPTCPWACSRRLPRCF